MQIDTDKFIEKILGKKFEVSIAYISDEKMKAMNKQYRKINKTTDILSFNIDKNVGQILISKKECSGKAREFGLRKDDYLPFILIHGLLHLKGYEHGAIMERHEKRFCKLLNVPIPYFLNSNLNPAKNNEQRENNSRDRHRDIPNKGSRRRADSR